VDRDPDGQVGRVGLGVLHEDVEIAVVVEDACVEQLVFGVVDAAPTVLDQLPVGVLPLRVLVEVLHVRVRRRVVEVEVILLDVLAVVRLAGHQAEEALFQDGSWPFHRARAKAMIW